MIEVRRPLSLQAGNLLFAQYEQFPAGEAPRQTIELLG